MATPITEAVRRLADTLEKHPELSAYKYPASAGDIDALGKKLDGIAASLNALRDLMQRLLSRSA